MREARRTSRHVNTSTDLLSFVASPFIPCVDVNTFPSSSFFFFFPLQKMSQEFEIKRLSLEEQRDRLQQQLDNLKEELSAKLNMANQEVQRTKPKASYRPPDGRWR